MTLPASGPISINQVNVELTLSGTTQTTMLFINNLVLASQRPAQPNMNAYYNKAYFQNNTNGNCNNGNCNCGDCNCACDFQCYNCYPNGNVNCLNCDTQKWLQTNCNCGTPYNCVLGEFLYNCNCDCACAC
jgi:hypothetical protein